MNTLCVLLLLFLLASASEATFNDTKLFNVMNYGAVADGKTNDAKAFESAWEDACAWEGLRPKVVIPKGTYLVGPLVFKGPCKGKVMVVQARGYVISPAHLNAYKTMDWISFQYIDGLLISGKGKFDGQGHFSWHHNNCHKIKQCTRLPWSLNFSFVKNAVIRGITSINSKSVHIQIFRCHHLHFHSINLTAPADSPNTDGIHIGESTDVKVTHSSIRTGDDCISIGPGTANMTVSKVWCGPGHGISIGSLGGEKDEGDVYGISVLDSTFADTDNGVRIKTWENTLTPSSVYDLRFENLVMENVGNPIIIDQKYCPHNLCTRQSPSLVKIRNVKFRSIRGETKTKMAINLVCSDAAPCEDIELSNINLKYSIAGDIAETSCANVKGHSTGIVSPPSCI